MTDALGFTRRLPTAALLCCWWQGYFTACARALLPCEGAVCALLHCGVNAQVDSSAHCQQPEPLSQPRASKQRSFPREDSGLQGRWSGWSSSRSSRPLPTTPFPSSSSPPCSISARAPQTGWACCWSIHRINFLSTPRAESINRYTNRHLKTCFMFC